MTNRLTCPEVAALLSASLDDALPHERRQGMDAHVAVCEACRQTLDGLRCTQRLLRALPCEPMPPGMKRHLLDTLQRRRRPAEP
ncbi:MAG: anti-sigma factor family protein [Longimicrobiales bacterium]